MKGFILIPSSPWAEIKTLFDAPADLNPAQREPILTQAALVDAPLADLRALSTLAARPLGEDAPHTSVRRGAWEIEHAVGVGGMGEAFEAKRADSSFEGRAAVKLLKGGMDSAAVPRRFAQVRQALARLDLFLQLADAVSHAHRNLQVHPDLKPGSVLMNRDGQVNLLDCGVAKVLDPLPGQDGHTIVRKHRPSTPLTMPAPRRCAQCLSPPPPTSTAWAYCSTKC